MLLDAIHAEMAELDALSRTRALTDRESRRLEHLVRLTTRPRRYASGRSTMGIRREAARYAAQERRA
ncbi:MAG: hypothetical protein ACK40O_00975 [Allosphingosinicella sp.]